MEEGDQIDGFGSSACVILGECRQLAFLGFEYTASSFFSFSTPPIASKGVALGNLSFFSSPQYIPGFRLAKGQPRILDPFVSTHC